MLIAITRAVSPAINRCELGFIERQEISLAKAEEQHRLYEACLGELGATVVSLAAEPGYPDSVFVEDPAVVVDALAVMTRMGAASRRGVRGVFENERGGLVNRDGARQAGLVGCVAGVQAPGRKTHLVGGSGVFRHRFQDTISPTGICNRPKMQ